MSKDYCLICLNGLRFKGEHIKIGNNLCNRMFILMFMKRIGNLMNDHQTSIYHCGVHSTDNSKFSVREGMI